MSLNKQSGNMYPKEICTHTWNPLGGECMHKCTPVKSGIPAPRPYCYVVDLKNNPVLEKRYSGIPRLMEDSLHDHLGKGKKIFVCNCTDLFAENVPSHMIHAILDRCCRFPDNIYLFQSKNVPRFMEFIGSYPPNTIFATTVETTNDELVTSKAPRMEMRVKSMAELKRMINDGSNKKVMVTIEPGFDFNVDTMVGWMKALQPDILTIGADSKRNDFIVEPQPRKIMELITRLNCIDMIILKKNIFRIIRVIRPMN